MLILKQALVKKIATPKIRFFSDKNRARFKEKLGQINWQDLYECRSSNVCAEKFSKNLTKCFDDCFPLKQLPKKRLKDKPWMSKGLRRCIRKKNKLYKLSLSRKETVMIDKYKKYKNILTKYLRTAEENYFKSILN